MVIWLASWPRSGNTLVRLVLHNAFGFSTYSKYLDRDLQLMGAYKVVGHAGQMCHTEASYRAFCFMDGVHFVKTHDMPPRDAFASAIHIVRDPRAVMWSYAHYRRDVDGCTDDFDDILTRLITRSRFGGWSMHTRAWMEYAGDQAMVKFEDLVDGPQLFVGKALKQLGVDYDVVGSLPSFDDLHAKWPKFFRKGKVAGWKDGMPQWAQDLIIRKHGDTMKRLGYATV
jgi:hypothetical protein